ncbi:hypothetical protein [Bradyrhizobium jicamae]|uniref:hypothetical protein n=1 Tax=Bradyrhizobium jicamae TaxID=280332 RepID=UPI0012ECD0DB|nr:hypothetical protein [Bradyrhizobium jicamae]
MKQSVAHGWQAWVLGSNNLWYRLPYTLQHVCRYSSGRASLEATRAATEREMQSPATINKWIIAQYDSERFSSDEW